MLKKFILILTIFNIHISNAAFGDEILKGFDAYKNNDYETAFEIWYKLAEEGDAIAQNSLGVLFQKGQGVEKIIVSLINGSKSLLRMVIRQLKYL